MVGKERYSFRTSFWLIGRDSRRLWKDSDHRTLALNRVSWGAYLYEKRIVSPQCSRHFVYPPRQIQFRLSHLRASPVTVQRIQLFVARKH